MISSEQLNTLVVELVRKQTSNQILMLSSILGVEQTLIFLANWQVEINSILANRQVDINSIKDVNNLSTCE